MQKKLDPLPIILPQRKSKHPEILCTGLRLRTKIQAGLQSMEDHHQLNLYHLIPSMSKGKLFPELFNLFHRSGQRNDAITKNPRSHETFGEGSQGISNSLDCISG